MRLVKCPFSISYIKRSDTPHYENVPFEVPEGWVWTTLEEICLFLSRGKSPKYSDIDKTYPVFAQKCNLKEGGISLEQARFLDPSTICKWSEEYKLKTGDVLVNSTGTGTVGRTRLFHESYLKNYPFVVPDSHISVIRTASETKSEFVFAYISSQLIQRHLENNLAGSTNQKELYIGVLADLLFPLPPLAEQQRIVLEIEKWFTLIDQIEQGKVDLQTVIKQTKNKILDLAIHGKLVPQDPNDKPASELLKRINPKAEITCDNGHYPLGWCKTQLKYIADYVNGRAFKPEEWETNGIPIVRIQNLNDEAAPYNKSSKSYEEKYLIHEGDLLFAWAASLGTYIWEKGDAWLNQHIFKVIPFVFMDKLYLYYSLESLIKDFYKESHGSGMVHITKKKFEDIECFVPPLSEQQRIVAKIEELFSILDKIKKALEA